MKNIIKLLFISLLVTGCVNQEQQKDIIKTKVLKQQEIAYITNQREIKLPETIKEPQEPINQEQDLSVIKNNHLIVIDAGHQAHGNSEQEPIGPGASETKAKVTTGATGVGTGKLESVINLEVAIKLQQKLETSGYQVKMIRTNQDVNISNRERAMIANDSNCAAFIRLHCNSADSSSVSGTLTMAPSLNNPYCSQIAKASYNLSKCIVDNICSQTGSRNRGVMISDTMSGINWCTVPVTIVEMGFLSNYEEDKLLSESSYQDKIVDGIVKGINAYME